MSPSLLTLSKYLFLLLISNDLKIMLVQGGKKSWRSPPGTKLCSQYITFFWIQFQEETLLSKLGHSFWASCCLCVFHDAFKIRWSSFLAQKYPSLEDCYKRRLQAEIKSPTIEYNTKLLYIQEDLCQEYWVWCSWLCLLFFFNNRMCV